MLPSTYHRIHRAENWRKGCVLICIPRRGTVSWLCSWGSHDGHSSRPGPLGASPRDLAHGDLVRSRPPRSERGRGTASISTACPKKDPRPLTVILHVHAGIADSEVKNLAQEYFSSRYREGGTLPQTPALPQRQGVKSGSFVFFSVCPGTVELDSSPLCFATGYLFRYLRYRYTCFCPFVRGRAIEVALGLAQTCNFRHHAGSRKKETPPFS